MILNVYTPGFRTWFITTEIVPFLLLKPGFLLIAMFFVRNGIRSIHLDAYLCERCLLLRICIPKVIAWWFFGPFFWPRTFWRCDSAYQQKDTVELFKANMKRHGWSITTFLSFFFSFYSWTVNRFMTKSYIACGVLILVHNHVTSPDYI